MIRCKSVSRKIFFHTDVKAGYVLKVHQDEMNKTRGKLQRYLPHHPIINPHKPQNLEEFATQQPQGVALNDNFLSGPDLLQSLIGIIFRFREHQIALSADIKAMFFQVVGSIDDSRCIRFLWRENTEQRIEVYEYARQNFGAKSLRNYALHQVAKVNAKDDRQLVRAVQQKFYMDNFLKSIGAPQEAIEVKKCETSSKRLIQFDDMDEEWRRSYVSDQRSRHINKICKNFRNRAKIMFNPWIKLKCGHS